MTGALPFPTARTLADWHGALAAWRPQALWAGHLFIHRVEAHAQRIAMQPLDRLFGLLLEAIRLESELSGDALLPRLLRRLPFPEPILRQLVRNLADKELLRVGPDDAWELTDRGRLALERKEMPQISWQRRSFAFAERLDSLGRRAAPPHFLPIAEVKASAWTPSLDLEFSPDVLDSCVRRDAEWKVRFGFPDDIRAFPRPDDSPQAWRNVMVVRPERVPAVLLEGDAIRVFLWKPEHGGHVAPQPLATLPREAKADLPELFPEPTSAEAERLLADVALQSSWSSSDRADARAEVKDGRLRVTGPAAVLERWPLRDWALLGDGPLRRAVRVSLEP